MPMPGEERRPRLAAARRVTTAVVSGVGLPYLDSLLYLWSQIGR